MSFTLDGTVTPGAMTLLGPYLTYDFSIIDPNSGLPSSRFLAGGQITTDGLTALTFSGNVSFLNLNQASFPMRATVAMTIYTSQLLQGSVDFSNTADVNIAMPPGFTATTSSGLPVNFAPVPEPATWALWVMGVILVGSAARRVSK